MLFFARYGTDIYGGFFIVKIKKKRYRLTPNSCRLGKAEQICEQMQREGYVLSKCGRYFMHFTPSSESFVYRAERSKYYISSANDRRCEYDEFYDAKGWLCIPGSGELRLYRAEEGKEPPDISQQMRIKTSKAAFRSSVIVLLINLIALIAFFSPLIFNIRGKLADDVAMSIIKGSTVTGFLAFSIIISLVELISAFGLYQANKRGERFDEPGFVGIAPITSSALSVLIVIFMGYMRIRSDPPPLPLPTNSENKPYFVLSDIGIELEGELQSAEKSDYIKRSSSLFSERTETYERLRTADSASAFSEGRGILIHLTQNIYKMKSSALKERLIEAIINSNRWSDHEITAEKLSFDGFDEVLLLSDGRIIAVKGSLVAELNYFCISPDDYNSPLNDEAVLNALAEKWRELN